MAAKKKHFPDLDYTAIHFRHFPRALKARLEDAKNRYRDSEGGRYMTNEEFFTMMIGDGLNTLLGKGLPNRTVESPDEIKIHPATLQTFPNCPKNFIIPHGIPEWQGGQDVC